MTGNNGAAKGRPRAATPDDQIERLHTEQGWGARRIYAHLVAQAVEVSFATVQRRLAEIRARRDDVPPSKMQPDPPDGYIGIAEAARLLGWSRQWAHKTLRSRDTRREGRRLWVSRQRVEELLAERQVQVLL